MPNHFKQQDLLNPEGRPFPGRPFYLFGAGHRRKLLYAGGVLMDALTREPLRRWDVTGERLTEAGALELTTAEGRAVFSEDEAGVWLAENGEREQLAGGPVHLPRFEGHPHAKMLRALHRELLVNIVDGAPLPNLLVYDRPWYRDAAMVGMVLARTGNLDLIRDWILGLREPFDRNNAGQRESDNLGQALYLVSLVSDAAHPLVKVVLDAVPEFLDGDHLTGPSDFAPHPVYQTKWLKFGLRALGLPDPYTVPAVFDPYSALFWMADRDQHVPGPDFGPALTGSYPYLGWAEAHFHRRRPPLELAGQTVPLTWEAEASQADYAGMAAADPALAGERLAAPHTWHAAEMVLYLLEAGLLEAGLKEA